MTTNRGHTLDFAPGWDTPFAGYAPEPWQPRFTAVGPDSETGRYRLQADWATGMKAVLQVCTNLADAHWQPLYTDTFVNATHAFTDSAATNQASRFYRLMHVP